MGYLLLIAYLVLPFFMARLAKKMGISRVVAVIVSLLFPFISLVVYFFLWREFKKKGKAEFRII